MPRRQPAGLHARERVAEQCEAVGVLPGRIGVREQAADVARVRPRPARRRSRHGRRRRHRSGPRARDRPARAHRQSRVDCRPRIDASRSRGRCAWRRPAPASLAAERLPRPRQVVLGRDLHVVRMSFHDLHPMAESLGQRRFVGHVDRRRHHRYQGIEHVAPEALRCLRQRQIVARDRAVDPATSRPRRTMCFTVSWTRAAAIAAPSRAAASMTRPMIASVTNGRAASCTSTTSASPGRAARPAATESCRRAPPGTTVQQLRAGSRRSEHARMLEVGGRHDGHDAADARRRRARRDAAFEDGAIAERQPLLGDGAAEAHGPGRQRRRRRRRSRIACSMRVVRYTAMRSAARVDRGRDADDRAARRRAVHAPRPRQVDPRGRASWSGTAPAFDATPRDVTLFLPACDTSRGRAPSGVDGPAVESTPSSSWRQPTGQRAACRVGDRPWRTGRSRSRCPWATSGRRGARRWSCGSAYPDGVLTLDAASARSR